MSETDDEAATAEDEFELVEVETGDIDQEGNLVVDDIVAVVGGGYIIAVDETVTTLTPDGDVRIDETLSVVGDDGELHAIEEDVTVLATSEAAKRPVKKAVKRTPAKKAAKRPV
jgi:hypothetical protein